MNKLLTKIVGAALGLTMTIGVGVAVASNNNVISKADAASPVTVTPSNFTGGKSGGGAAATASVDGIDIEVSSAYIDGTAHVRGYSGATITFDGTPTISSIVFTSTASGTSSNGPSKIDVTSGAAGAYSYSGNKGTWTGSTSNVSLTCSAQFRFTQIEITYSGGGQSETKFTVSFDANMYEYVENVESITQASEGAAITLPTLTYDDYTFVGWNSLASGGQSTRVSSPYTPSDNITLYGEWTENIPSGANAYHLKDMFETGSWSNSYNTDHSHTFTTGDDTITVTARGASKQTSTIKHVPVSKGGDVELVLTSPNHYIKDVIFVAKQWTDKAQTMTLHTSSNNGTSYTSTGITSTNFRISNSSSFADTTNAIKISFSSTSNQVGLVKFYVSFGTLSDHFIVSSGTTGLSVSPQNTTADGGDITLTTEAYYKGSNIQVTNATISATNGNVITLSNVTGNVEISATLVSAVPNGELVIANAKEKFTLEDSFSFGGTVTATFDDWVSPHSSRALESSEYTVDSSAFVQGTEGNYTIVVSSVAGSATKSYSVQVANQVTYSLVTDASDLEDGDQLVLARSTGTAAMGSQGANTYRASVSVTVVDDAITGPSDDVKIITLEGNSSAWYLNTDEGYLYYTGSSNTIQTKAAKDDSCRWTIAVTNAGVATIANVSNSSRFISYNSSQPRFACYTSVQNNVSLFAAPRDPSVTRIQLAAANIAMEYGDSDVAPTVTNADTSDVITGCEFTSSNESVATIVSNKIHAVGRGTSTITATHAEDTQNKIVYKSATFTVTVSKTDTIQDLYTFSANTDVEFDGYYAGEYADGIVLMDGELGMLVYKATSETSWVIDQTVLHVSGKTTAYDGLVEIAQGADVSVQTDAAAKAKLDVPSNHHLTASDASSTDATLANRRTFVTGTLTACTASSNNYNITISVNESNLALYLKAADNTTIPGTETTISDYLTSKLNSVVTIKGFTSFHSNSFQVRVYGVVETDTSYTVAHFAQDVLDETDAVCENALSYENRNALATVWSDLEEKWVAMSETEQNKWLDTTTYTPNYDNDSSEVIENALGRYNYLCKKYFSDNNFTGRSDVNGAPVNPSSKINVVMLDKSGIVATLVVIALLGTTTIAAYYFLRKRKEQ